MLLVLGCVAATRVGGGGGMEGGRADSKLGSRQVEEGERRWGGSVGKEGGGSTPTWNIAQVLLTPGPPPTPTAARSNFWVPARVQPSALPPVAGVRAFKKQRTFRVLAGSGVSTAVVA